MGKRIAILMGGKSLERDVSIRSGRRVSRALHDLGHTVFDLDVDETLIATLKRLQPELVYIALHGKYGEDGTIQELLEILDIPYTGPGVLASTLGFNKVLSKELFIREGIPTPPFFTLSAATFQEMGALDIFPELERKIGFPLVIKPAAQGSALGVKMVSSPSEVAPAVMAALGYDEHVIIEQYISGTEVAVSILGNDALEPLPLVEIVPKSGFFDFDARYTMGAAEFYIPARLDEAVAERTRQFALRAHTALGCRNVSRVDAIIDEAGNPYVLELNISPGMTDTSLLPLAAHAAGMSFPQLVERLIELALSK
ncbi:MAG: D-alanine--D-alanine ligase family protein [Candidatus Geothermincolia bacterium]